mmetsp:Transcript_827/g.1970  ORF Transcript_827/g.1970 Transcript_827/m.1970 type:complete len:242 (+) Transcript_827:1162-1887(+)
MFRLEFDIAAVWDCGCDTPSVPHFGILPAAPATCGRQCQRRSRNLPWQARNLDSNRIPPVDVGCVPSACLPSTCQAQAMTRTDPNERPCGFDASAVAHPSTCANTVASSSPPMRVAMHPPASNHLPTSVALAPPAVDAIAFVVDAIFVAFLLRILGLHPRRRPTQRVYCWKDPLCTDAAWILAARIAIVQRKPRWMMFERSWQRHPMPDDASWNSCHLGTFRHAGHAVQLLWVHAAAAVVP